MKSKSVDIPDAPTRDFLPEITSAIRHIQPYRIFGKILEIHGLTLKASADLPQIVIGCGVTLQKQGMLFQGEVIALHKNHATILLATPIQGLSIGDVLEYSLLPLAIAPHESWCGRILNAYAEPIDEKEPLVHGEKYLPLRAHPIPAHKRLKIHESLDLGIRSLNAFATTCKGQRLGIFAGSGVGKSVLLSMLVRFTRCDIAVIGLIGERGRELKEFIEDTLKEHEIQKSIVVVATSDEPPLARRQAAYTTLTIAEAFRNQGKNVLCILDSLTRFAMAQREIGLSSGEPPTTKGYPPSTFSELAMLCERAGPGHEKPDLHIQPGGCITGLFSVLVDGDDYNEPISDAVRGLLDGHIILDRTLAERGIYPAVNVLKSLSRLSQIAQTKEQLSLVMKAKKILSTYEDMADLIRLGAYQEGANPEVDHAIKLRDSFLDFLVQKPDEWTSLEETFKQLEAILSL